jgi:hypothetical protein
MVVHNMQTISRYVIGAVVVIAFFATFSCSNPSTEQQKKEDEATNKALSNHDSGMGFKPLPRFGEASPTPWEGKQ